LNAFSGAADKILSKFGEGELDAGICMVEIAHNL
jgi:hypothetical protein